MKESLVVKQIFNVLPSVLYQAWLNSDLHSQMTGGEAHCSEVVGDAFSAWDGYISGKNITLVENQKIVQSWRTTEFDEQDEDSILTIEFSEVGEGTEVVITHTNIPEGQTQYEQGWLDHYFTPMLEYFQK